MRKLYLLMLLLLSGCSTMYGNYSQAPNDLQAQMATATAKQLVKVYPPAQTHFTMTTPQDSYGRDLMQQLRLQGYAMATVKHNANLHYVVSQSSKFYRVSIMVNQQVLSQVYQPTKDGGLYAAGFWTFKE